MRSETARIPSSTLIGMPAVEVDVLVVDDQEAAANEMAHCLTNAGLRCSVFSNPWQALQRLAHQDGPPVAVVDVRMPELSGLDLVGRLNAINVDKRPEYILVSAIADFDDALVAMRMGVRRLLRKPLNLAELVREVKGACVERELRIGRTTTLSRPRLQIEQLLTINAMIALSRWRERIFPREMLSDHCWRMILELYQLACRERSVSLTSIALVSGLPMATAVRRIHAMRDLGLVTFTPDMNDKRRTFVKLSETGAQQVKLFLMEIEAEMMNLQGQESGRNADNRD